MKKTLTLLTLVALTATAWGHGAQPHHASATPVVKEQKAWGIAGEARAVTRTITLTMDDRMRFTPSHLEVREGETVRLRVANKGRVMHELVLGTRTDLDEHAEMMKKFPGMEHDEPHMAHVGPGRRGNIVWTFNRAGDFLFACLIAGHYQAGMVGTIRVQAAAKP